MNKLVAFCNRIYEPKARNFVMAVIIINAVVLGLDTYPYLRERYGDLLTIVDHICVGVFVIEIAMKFVVVRLRFFLSGWNLFDFFVVAISLVPGANTISVLRAFRIFRVIRLIGRIEKLKIIVEALLSSLPSIGWIGLLLTIVFYTFSVLCVTIFGETFDEWFGSIGAAMYTLFQILTLESWSMGIVRPLMAEYPYAYLIFIPFILIASFIMVNALVGIVINSLNELAAAKAKEKEQEELGKSDLAEELNLLKNQILKIEKMIAAQESKEKT
ncbi:MAG: ion transporter [Helicobacteraceae bacterium]|jgi:voltage-gated sodium channel|nr:ion transporter [Helicobacteraceae bacterium]